MRIALPLVLALVGVPSLAAAQSAQSAPAPAPAAPPAAESAVTVVRQGNRTIYRVEMGILYGDVQRPYAFAVSGRSPLGYTAVDDPRSFVGDVTTAVRREPF